MCWLQYVGLTLTVWHVFISIIYQWTYYDLLDDKMLLFGSKRRLMWRRKSLFVSQVGLNWVNIVLGRPQVKPKLEHQKRYKMLRMYMDNVFYLWFVDSEWYRKHVYLFLIWLRDFRRFLLFSPCSPDLELLHGNPLADGHCHCQRRLVLGSKSVGFLKL